MPSYVKLRYLKALIDAGSDLNGNAGYFHPLRIASFAETKLMIAEGASITQLIFKKMNILSFAAFFNKA
jgi:hypothetical protein